MSLYTTKLGYYLRFGDPFDTEAALQKLREARPVEDPDAEANLRWGAASDFSSVSPSGRFVPYPYGAVNYPPDPDEDDEEDERIEDWDEEKRTTSTKRIENPDDADQYVIVEVIDSIVFKRPNNIKVRLNLSNN